MDLHELQTTLRKNMRVEVYEDGVKVAEGTITNLVPGELEFTDGDPKYEGFKKEFGYMPSWNGWAGLHEDPFTKARCFSQMGHVYLFKPIEALAATAA